jgi:rod shape-determining protein MreD
VIVTPRILVRLALLILTAVIVQVAFFSSVSFLGASPDFLTVVVVSLGLLGGGVIGAVCGFSAGLLLDSALLQTLGVSSLVLLTAGYLAGRYRESWEITGRLVPSLLAAGLTVLASTAYALIQVMLGVDAPVSLLVVREVVVKGLLSFLLMFGVYPLIRRVLRPALVDDTAPRRPLPSPMRAASWAGDS